VEQFGGPEVLRVVDIADPRPAEGEVVVRLHAAGVNPVDAYIRSGQYARLPERPYTPGFDGAGVIEAVGPGVTSPSVGDRVYTAALGIRFGTYAERTACAAHLVHLLPKSISFAQGAALGVPAATAFRALVIRAASRAGDTLLVHGASGAVGTAAVQLAHAMGLRVIGTAGSDAGRTAVHDGGADHVLDHTKDGYAAEVMAITGGRGVDVILEMLASVNLDRDLGMLAPKGRVVVIGSRGRIEIDPRQTMGKESAVLGTTLWASTPEEYRQTHAALGAALATGVLRPVIGRQLPLDAAPDAHLAILQGHAAGKIVLTM
jgi:NADPH2:quinone reductase